MRDIDSNAIQAIGSPWELDAQEPCCSECERPIDRCTCMFDDIEIKTERAYNGEWMAWCEDYIDGAPDGTNLIGWGKTPELARADLKAQLAETKE